MVGAMVLLLLVMGAFVAFRDLNRTEPEDPIKPVEWQDAASYARQEADFDLVAPRRLPDGWIATSVRFDQAQDDQAWHLGMLTQERRYVGLEQTQDPAVTMVEEFLDPEAERGEDVVIDGRAWQTWSHEDEDALVSEGSDATALVTGTVSQEELARFAGSLR